MELPTSSSLMRIIHVMVKVLSILSLVYVHVEIKKKQNLRITIKILLSKMACCLLTNTDTYNIMVRFLRVICCESLSFEIYNCMHFISFCISKIYVCLLFTCGNQFHCKGCKEKHPCSSYVPPSLSRTSQNFCTKGWRCWKLSGHYRSVFTVLTF